MTRSPSGWFALAGTLLLVVACACSQPAPRGPDPGSGSTGNTGGGDDDDTTTDPGDDDDDTEPLPGQGEKCNAAGACATGLTCMKYYGIAGPSGPLFTSCEIACSDGCPDGQQCITIADGPGEVCRPTSP
jgi:hypothetical protein